MKKKKAFSLVELIISIGIFSLLFAPILALMTHNVKLDHRALIHNLATYTAKLDMEMAYGLTAGQLLAQYNQPKTFYADADLEGLWFEYAAAQYAPELGDDTLSLFRVTINVGSDEFGFVVSIDDIITALN
jgi:prepilin-type N-terminal cleavage/methylation domain-containing protein